MGFFSRKPWDMPLMINAARSIHATEVIFQVGEPVMLATPLGARTIAGRTWTQALYDERIMSRLDAFARESVGKVAAEVGPDTTRMKLL